MSRGDARLRRVVVGSGLPASLQERVRSVVAASGVTGEARLDVARELVAHFEDGLASGRSEEELLATFGDDALTARLIGRARGRSEDRPPDPAPSSGGGESFLAGLARDLRYAIRRLRQRPGFSATAVLSLALGIGANTAVFSLVNAILLTEAPVRAPEELVDVYYDEPEFAYNVFSYPDLEDVRRSTGEVFSGVLGSGFSVVPVETAAGVELRFAEVVTGNYFEVLGIQAGIGRLLGPEDDTAPGAHPVAVLGHPYWQRVHQGDPGVVGERLRINGLAYTIVGVAPADFDGSLRGLVPDLFLPMAMYDQVEGRAGDPDEMDFSRFTSRGSHSIFVKARLRPDATVEDARGVLAAVAEHLQETYPDDWAPDDGFALVPTREVVLFPPVDAFIRPAAWVFMALAGLVLLVACANLASFLLARAMDRSKEIALRLALGASRGALFRQLLTETTLLGLLGGGAGVLLAAWLLHVLVTAELPLPFPLTLNVGLDPAVLGFSVTVSLAAGVLFGLVPALHVTRTEVAAALKEGGRGGAGGLLSPRNGLVVAQVAISVVLLVAAGLFVRSFRATLAVDPGFGDDPAGILSVSVPATRYDDGQAWSLRERLLVGIGGLPGVQAVGIIDDLHLDPLNTQWRAVNVDGLEPPAGQDGFLVDWARVDPGFFEAVGIGLVRGRGFTEGDLGRGRTGADRRPNDPGDPAPATGAGAAGASGRDPDVAIVSEAMARRFWPDGGALGRVFRLAPEQDRVRVVGVVEDAKVRTLGEAPRSMFYSPHRDPYGGTLVARTSGKPEQTVEAMMRVAREVDPRIMIFQAKTMESHLAAMLLPARLSALVLTAFAGLALALATIGLYGIVSYAVAQRTREVGLRLSLGAEPGEVVRWLTVGGLKLVAVGVAIGVLLALATARALSTLLFGVGPFDVTTFATVVAVLLAVSVLAAWIPARRASRVDPVESLRAE